MGGKFEEGVGKSNYLNCQFQYSTLLTHFVENKTILVSYLLFSIIIFITYIIFRGIIITYRTIYCSNILKLLPVY
jgi:hypothetical protein